MLRWCVNFLAFPSKLTPILRLYDHGLILESANSPSRNFGYRTMPEISAYIVLKMDLLPHVPSIPHDQSSIILEAFGLLSTTAVVLPPQDTPMHPYANSHANPSGPGDARPSALQIISDQKLEGALQEKTIVITGCTSGIGIETARALHATGATLFLTVRDVAKGRAVVADILRSSKGSGRMELLLMDLSNLASVRAAATDFITRSDRLDVLIANAGVVSCPESKTADGFELQMGTNHFGHFLFFQLLKPLLLTSSTSESHSRVVVVSSWSHTLGSVRFDDIDFARSGYDKWLAYAQAKTANIYMANSIERHYRHRGLHGLSLHPGNVFGTEALRHATQENIAQVGDMSVLRKWEKSVPQGAATSVWAAVAKELEGRGGMYLADVGEAEPVRQEDPVGGPGYAPHAFNEQAEERLWRLSYEAVGLEYED